MLSKFAEATMLKGRGKKGGGVSRKQKTPSMIETRVQNSSMTCKDMTQSDVFQISPTHGSYGFQLGNTANIHSPFYFNSPMYSMHYPHMSGFTTLPITAPFTLCKISGNISVCSGCRNKYSKNPKPPDDVCIKHQEWHEYTLPG